MESSVRGRNPGWKDTFVIDDKGERFIRCKGKCKGKGKGGA